MSAPTPLLLPLPAFDGAVLRLWAPATPDAPEAAAASTAGWPVAAAWLTADAAAVTTIRLPNDIDDATLDALAPRLSSVTAIALDFPKWVDGRAYSVARLLRRRYRFGGELRATGHVLVDMLPLLARCGFDAAVLRPGQSVEAARRALGFFDGHYQGDVLQPQPPYRRQAA